MTLVDSLAVPLMLFVGLALTEVVFGRAVDAVQIRVGPRMRQGVVRSLFHYLQLHSHRISETAMSTLQILCAAARSETTGVIVDGVPLTDMMMDSLHAQVSLIPQFIQDVRPLNPALPNTVGEACTLRYIPAREDLNPVRVFEDRDHPQRKVVEECPPGAVLVIDSRKNARAASAGSILLTRLMKRGVAGVVTDGGFRDSAEITRLDMPAYHQRPSAPTNLTLHQALDINVPIGCGDAPVWPGDVIVGDAEGVMVIPAAIVDQIAAEALEMTAFEDFVSEKVHEGRSILGLYPPTDERSQVDFAAWRATHKR